VTSHRDTVAVHVWRDDPAAQERDVDDYYSVSEVDEHGDEIRCIGGDECLGDAWDLGRDHAESLGVPCIEYAGASSEEETDRWDPPDHDSRVARAAEYIDAVDLGDGGWAYRAEETGSWWVITAEELEELCDYIDSDDPMIAGDAYSHWCAGCGGEEQPSWWAPDTQTVEDAAREAIESATFAGEGTERVTTRSYQRELAEAMAVILRERGMDAAWVPDCDDSSRAWLYACDGADSKLDAIEEALSAWAEPSSRDENSLTYAVSVPSADAADYEEQCSATIAHVRELLVAVGISGVHVMWTGSGNTDSSGDTAEDLRVKIASDADVYSAEGE